MSNSITRYDDDDDDDDDGDDGDDDRDGDGDYKKWVVSKSTMRW